VFDALARGTDVSQFKAGSQRHQLMGKPCGERRECFGVPPELGKQRLLGIEGTLASVIATASQW
jgi:hypothetical protein